jgi:hypothetical protein
MRLALFPRAVLCRRHVAVGREREAREMARALVAIRGLTLLN